VNINNGQQECKSERLPSSKKAKTKTEKPPKIVSVLSRVIFFAILFILGYFILTIALSNLLIFVTGISNSTEFPRALLWTIEIVGYLLALIMISGLLFGPKVKSKVADENIPKLKKAISLVFAISVVLLTVMGLFTGTYGVIDAVIYVVIILTSIAIGFLLINKILSGSLRIRYLYFELGLAAMIVIVGTGFFVSEEAFVLTTGRYGHGTAEDNELADMIFGYFAAVMAAFHAFHAFSHNNLLKKTAPLSARLLM